MTIKQLHKITADLIATSHADMDVMVDIESFSVSENGSVMPIESSVVRPVQGADDSGPVGEEYPMLVLYGNE